MSRTDPAKIKEYRERLAVATKRFEVSFVALCIPSVKLTQQTTRMRSHFNMNHKLDQVLKAQRAMQSRPATTPVWACHSACARSEISLGQTITRGLTPGWNYIGHYRCVFHPRVLLGDYFLM